MGKSGKHRKRVRMLREHERAAAVLNSGGGSAGGASSNDGVQRQAGVDASARDDGEEGDDDGEVDYAGGILPEDLATTVATLHTIGHNTELLKLKDFKALRGALHPVLEVLFKMKKADAAESSSNNVGGKKRRRQNNVDPNGGRGKAAVVGGSAASASVLGAPLPAASAGSAGRKSVALASNAVSQAMSGGRWEAAIAQLAAMRGAGMVPQLGSVQRWVRACDAAEHDPAMLRILDAILRTCDPHSTAVRPPPPLQTPALLSKSLEGGSGSGSGSASASASAVKITGPAAPGTLHRHPPWCPTALPQQPQQQQNGGEGTNEGEGGGRVGSGGSPGGGAEMPTPASAAVEAHASLPTVKYSKEVLLSWASKYKGVKPPEMYTSCFRVIHHEKGADRRPANKFDLDIYGQTAPVLDYTIDPPCKQQLVKVPFVQGAFAMVDVLSKSECAQIIAAAEAVGYAADEPAGANFSNGATGTGRAAAFVWLTDSTSLDPLYERCKALLPQELGGGKVAGLNARWRLYRYGQEAVYRPHVDGAWPGSGMKDGILEYDAFSDRWSRLTFLLYLNDGFEGGCTTFFTPAKDDGCLDAQGVQPRAGTVLCFPHGDTAGSLVHEGSSVTSGTKYIVRSDVLYLKPGVKE